MKVKCSLINEKFHNLSRIEWNLFYFLIRHSDEKTAIVEGVYYRDVVKETGMCNQSFYDALEGLEEKKIIKVTRKSDLDYDVWIPGNEYPEQTKEAYKEEPYINLNMDVFYTEAFNNLKAHEKYLFLRFLICSHMPGQSMKRKVKEFYDELTKLLNVSKRVIRSYLCSLKQFFYIGIKEGLYYITCKKKTTENSRGRKSEEMWSLEQFIRMECHRNHTKYNEKTVYDTAELVQTARPQFESCGTSIILSFIKECIKKSVTGLLWRDRELSPAYINKLLYEKLNAMTPLQKENAQKLALNITNANKNRFHDSSERMKYDELEELLLTTSLI